MLIKKILPVVIVGGLIECLFAQSGSVSNSVYVALFNTVSSATATSSVLNIGQTGHQVVLKMLNAPTKICSPAINTVGQLEFSSDNATWVAFGYPQGPINGQTSITYVGSGAYPYVRFNLISFDTTNCVASATYMGSLNTAGGTTQIGQFTVQHVYNATVMPATGSSSPIYVSNYGQTTHALSIAAVNNAPAKSCVSTDGYQISLLGTTNAIGGGALQTIASITINGNSASATSGYDSQVFGYGLYSTLEIVTTRLAGTPSDCAVTMDYVGTNTTGLPATSTTLGSMPIVQCDSSSIINVASGTGAILPSEATLTGVVHICAISLQPVAATTVTLLVGGTNVTACDNPIINLGKWQFTSTTPQSVNLGSGLGSITEFSNAQFTGFRNDWCLTTSAAAVTGMISYTTLPY